MQVDDEPSEGLPKEGGEITQNVFSQTRGCLFGPLVGGRMLCEDLGLEDVCEIPEIVKFR